MRVSNMATVLILCALAALQVAPHPAASNQKTIAPEAEADVGQADTRVVEAETGDDLEEDGEESDSANDGEDHEQAEADNSARASREFEFEEEDRGMEGDGNGRKGGKNTASKKLQTATQASNDGMFGGLFQLPLPSMSDILPGGLFSAFGGGGTTSDAKGSPAGKQQPASVAGKSGSATNTAATPHAMTIKTVAAKGDSGIDLIYAIAERGKNALLMMGETGKQVVDTTQNVVETLGLHYEVAGQEQERTQKNGRVPKTVRELEEGGNEPSPETDEHGFLDRVFEENDADREALSEENSTQVNFFGLDLIGKPKHLVLDDGGDVLLKGVRERGVSPVSNSKATIKTSTPRHEPALDARADATVEIDDIDAEEQHEEHNDSSENDEVVMDDGEEDESEGDEIARS